jgi:16S rRNA (guanine966-N2)-methyltransferase
MRIVAGTLGGRRLRAPAGAATRPTSERVREALFNILGPPGADTWVLDLFAGAGGLGLEALSRGAVGAVFVDAAAPALRILRENIAALGVGAAARIVAADAVAAVARLPDEPRFRWVFLDPPYAGDLARRGLDALVKRTLLTPDATVVVEHDRRNSPLDRHGSLIRTDRRRYGDSELSFYQSESSVA